MKDWKFLQVGNAKTGNYESSTQRPDSKIYQTIHEFIKTSGGDADKAFVAIKRKYPNLTDEFIEKSIDEVIRTNKAGNESIDKQEWSLYQGLKKDAEKEIGNSTWRMRHGTIAEVKDDGTVIYSKNGMTSKEKFETKEKAEEHLKFIGSTKVENSDKEIGNADTDAKFAELYKSQEWEKLSSPQQKKIQLMAWLRQGKITSDEFAREARKIGNATGDEYNAEIQRLTKKAEQLRRMGQGKSAMEIEKQIEKLGKELSELGNKKTGNRTIRTEKKGDWVVVYINGWKAGAGKAEYKGSVLGWQTDGNTYGMTPSGMKSSSAFRKTYRTEPTDKQIEKDLIEDFWIHHNDKETMEKIGNKKVGNAFDAGIHLTIRYNGKEEEVKVLKDMPTSVLVKGQNGAVVEIKKVDLDVLKVHNAKPGSIASIGPAWMYGGTVYGKMDTDESGKKHNEYVKITWLGEGKGGVANYFIDDKMQSDKLGSLDKNELKRWAEQKVGNVRHSKEQLLADVRELKKYIAQHPDAYKEKMLLGEALEELDKYYGVIVPNQEPKVDNLKRARNAMNKKCGNATKTFSGKYLDIYDNGHVVVKEGWAFGEKFNEDNFGRWIEEQIRAKEKVLQECKQMKREFEST